MRTRPTSPTAIRPCFDLTADDLRALAALPPPYPDTRDARIRALLAAWWARTDRPGMTKPAARRAALLVIPTARGKTRSLHVRLDGATLARVDRERGAATRGAWLRAVLDAMARG